jgi:hypothetical protein
VSFDSEIRLEPEIETMRISESGHQLGYPYLVTHQGKFKKGVNALRLPQPRGPSKVAAKRLPKANGPRR